MFNFVKGLFLVGFRFYRTNKAISQILIKCCYSGILNIKTVSKA